MILSLRLLAFAATLAALPSLVHAQARPNEAFVTHVYQTVLRRAPDPGGLAGWVGQMNAGMTRTQVATHFYASAEYGRRSDEDFVDSLYRLALCRAADAGGRAQWLEHLRRGMDRGRVVREVFASPEAQQKVSVCPPPPAPPPAPAPSTPPVAPPPPAAAAPPPPAAAPQPPPSADVREVERPAKSVVQHVRHDKDDIALKLLAGEAQGVFLLGEDWSRASGEQRREFTRLFNGLLALYLFPKVRENFKNLSSIRYDAPVVDGDRATMTSTIVIAHTVRTQELPLTYHLVRVGAEWKLLDVVVLERSLLGGIRDEQVQPVLREGGMELLLRLMQERHPR